MLNNSGSQTTKENSMEPTPIFIQKLLDRCHVVLPDTPKPTSAVMHDGQYYTYVRFFTDVDAARQKAALIQGRGTKAILTRVPKGLVLWALDPDAQPVQ